MRAAASIHGDGGPAKKGALSVPAGRNIRGAPILAQPGPAAIQGAIEPDPLGVPGRRPRHVDLTGGADGGGRPASETCLRGDLTRWRERGAVIRTRGVKNPNLFRPPVRAQVGPD